MGLCEITTGYFESLRPVSFFVVHFQFHALGLITTTIIIIIIIVFKYTYCQKQL